MRRWRTTTSSQSPWRGWGWSGTRWSLIRSMLASLQELCLTQLLVLATTRTSCPHRLGILSSWRNRSRNRIGTLDQVKGSLGRVSQWCPIFKSCPVDKSLFKIQIEIFQNDLQKAAPLDMKRRNIVLLKLLNSIFEDEGGEVIWTKSKGTAVFSQETFP